MGSGEKACNEGEGAMTQRKEEIDLIDAALAAAYGDPEIVRSATPRARKAREKRAALSPDDGRRRRATGRTAQFNVKMKPELRRRTIQASRAHDMPISVFVERALEAFLTKLEGKDTDA